MKRWELISLLANARGYRRYLEIGVDAWQCLRRIDMPIRVGVDPEPVGPPPEDVDLFCMESDAFFLQNGEKRFDLIFVDGLHHASQVYRDVIHSLAVLAEGGTIVLHDCSPMSEDSQRVPRPEGQVIWHGDCWRAVAQLRAEHAELDVMVLNTDRGLGIVRPNEGQPAVWSRPYEGRPWSDLAWLDLVANRTDILNLIPCRDVKVLL